MEVTREKRLPSLEERRRILEQAGIILAEARALADELDHLQAWQIWALQTDQLSFTGSQIFPQTFRSGMQLRDTALHPITRSSSR